MNKLDLIPNKGNIVLILGDITFFDQQIDEKHEAIIHEIKRIIHCDSLETASKLGEDSLDSSESYLIPELYKGKIKNEIGYYAIDKDKNVFPFEWGEDNSFYIFNNGKKELTEAINYEIINSDFLI